MKAPISFVYGNCVFGKDLSDGWAAFAVSLDSYEWLSRDEKRARFVALVGALESAEADIQLLRVSDRCDHRRAGGVEHHHGVGALRTAEHSRYLSAQLRELGAHEATTAGLYMFVSLREPELDVASYVSRAAGQRPSEWWAALTRNLWGQGRRTIAAAELERARVRADRAHARLADFLSLRPARGVELQWLIRRAFCRGLGEPLVDGLHEPSALVFERNGEAVLAPLEGDVMRWINCELEQRSRSLLIESELGVSWQAQLALGAVPELVGFPGRRAELMFAPPEALPFAIDISLTARFLPNERGAEARTAKDPGRRSDPPGRGRR